MYRYLLIAVFAAALLVSCSNPKQALQQYVLRGATMGTTYNIKILVPADSADSPKRLHSEIQLLLDHANAIASTYLDDSELSKLNQANAGEWLPVSNELYAILITAREISEKSKGAFDITVGPLVNLWGFGPEHNLADVPSLDAIEARKARVGYEKLAMRKDLPMVKKSIDSLYCDLSAIAKGWAVDKVADYLEQNDVLDYLVEIGGEIRAHGHNQKNSVWRIGISSPSGDNEIERIISLTDIGVATSGDYRNYFEKDGVRYSHTIDPRTGRPIQHELASVTVVHPSCMMADAYATAIDVLGPKEGYDFAVKNELSVFMIIRSSNGFEEKMTTSFSDYIAH